MIKPLLWQSTHYPTHRLVWPVVVDLLYLRVGHCYANVRQ